MKRDSSIHRGLSCWLNEPLWLPECPVQAAVRIMYDGAIRGRSRLRLRALRSSLGIVPSRVGCNIFYHQARFFTEGECLV